MEEKELIKRSFEDYLADDPTAISTIHNETAAVKVFLRLADKGMMPKALFNSLIASPNQYELLAALADYYHQKKAPEMREKLFDAVVQHFKEHEHYDEDFLDPSTVRDIFCTAEDLEYIAKYHIDILQNPNLVLFQEFFPLYWNKKISLKLKRKNFTSAWEQVLHCLESIGVVRVSGNIECEFRTETVITFLEEVVSIFFHELQQRRLFPKKCKTRMSNFRKDLVYNLQQIESGYSIGSKIPGMNLVLFFDILSESDKYILSDTAKNALRIVDYFYRQNKK